MYLPGEQLIVKARFVEEESNLLVRISNEYGGWSGIAHRFEFDAEQDMEMYDDPTRTATCLYHCIAEQLVSNSMVLCNWLKMKAADCRST
jgi:hypothetical protein